MNTTHQPLPPVAYHLLMITTAMSLFFSSILFVRLIHIGPFIMGSGALESPFTYICLVLIAEFYGFAAARRAIWTAVYILVMGIVAFFIAATLPSYGSQNPGVRVAFGAEPPSLYSTIGTFVLAAWFISVAASRLKLRYHGHHQLARIIALPLIGLSVNILLFYAVTFLVPLGPSRFFTLLSLRLQFAILYYLALIPFAAGAMHVLRRYESYIAPTTGESYAIVDLPGD